MLNLYEHLVLLLADQRNQNKNHRSVYLFSDHRCKALLSLLYRQMLLIKRLRNGAICRLISLIVQYPNSTENRHSLCLSVSSMAEMLLRTSQNNRMYLLLSTIPSLV